MSMFSPPAQVDDFTRSSKADELATGWDAIIDHWLTRAVDGTDGRFYNPHHQGAPGGGTEAPIVWDAFPLVIKRWFESEVGGDEKRYRAADALRPLRPGGRRLRAVRNGTLREELEVFHRQQDEYCEWFVERTNGAITGLQFTSEGPEYWQFLVSGTASFFDEGDARRDLTAGDPDLAVALYREHVSADVQLEDLLWQHDVAAWNGTGWSYYAFAGEYNPYNRWNTTAGAMHLTHPSNTLQAEVRLAADATIQRPPAANARSLACCAGFGDANRSSDPLIGLAVNQAVAGGNTVTLADPIGLYIAELNSAALSVPDAWRATRGSQANGRILRARIDVPPEGLEVGGVQLSYGGQVAEHIQMVLTGLVVSASGSPPPVRGCEASCCSHPDRPEFRQVVGSGANCGAVSWSGLGPFLPAQAGAPTPSATRGSGLSDAEAQAPIAPRPSAVLARR